LFIILLVILVFNSQSCAVLINAYIFRILDVH